MKNPFGNKIPPSELTAQLKQDIYDYFRQDKGRSFATAYSEEGYDFINSKIVMTEVIRLVELAYKDMARENPPKTPKDLKIRLCRETNFFTDEYVNKIVEDCCIDDYNIEAGCSWQDYVTRCDHGE